MSCPAVGTCVAVRGGDVSVQTAGGGWSTPRQIDPAGQLDAVSCPTTAFCMAADAYGDVMTWPGSTWSAPVKVVTTPVEYPGDGTSLACPSDQYCMILTGDGDYATYQGDDPTAGVAPATLSARVTVRDLRGRHRRSSARASTVRQFRVVATRPRRRSRNAFDSFASW